MHPSPASTAVDTQPHPQPPPILKVTSRIRDGAERTALFRDTLKKFVWKNIVPPTPPTNDAAAQPPSSPPSGSSAAVLSTSTSSQPHSSPRNGSTHTSFTGCERQMAGPVATHSPTYPTPISDTLSSDEEPSPSHKRRKQESTTETIESTKETTESTKETIQSTRSSIPVIELDVSDWLFCGDIADIFSPKVLDAAQRPAWIPRHGLVAKLCTPGYYNNVRGKYTEDQAAHMIEREAHIYASLPALQGKAISRFYGLWRGEYRHDDDVGLMNEMYVMLLEDVGATLDSEGPMIAKRRNKHVHDAYDGLHAAGVVHNIVDSMHICTREPDPDRLDSDTDDEIQNSATPSDSVCLVDFTRALTREDKGFDEALASEKRYLDAWLPLPQASNSEDPATNA